MKAYFDKGYQTRRDELIDGDKDFERTAQKALIFYMFFILSVFVIYMTYYAS